MQTMYNIQQQQIKIQYTHQIKKNYYKGYYKKSLKMAVEQKHAQQQAKDSTMLRFNHKQPDL